MALSRTTAAILSFVLWGLGHIVARKGRHAVLPIFAHLLFYYLLSLLLLLPGITILSIVLLSAPVLMLSAFFAIDVSRRTDSVMAVQVPLSPTLVSSGQNLSAQAGYCHSCGSRLKESAKFCHACGARVG